jgi:iron complex transport system permease protein
VTALLLVAVGLLSLSVGFIDLSAAEVLAALSGDGEREHRLVVREFRLPRLAVAALVGAGLSLSGVVLQGLSRNALAEPGIIGINAGAGFGVVLLLYLSAGGRSVRGLASAPSMMLPLAALVGAGVAAAAVFGIASKRGSLSPVRLLLVGIAVNAAVGAATLVVSMRLDQQLYNFAVTWLTGTIAGVGWGEAAAPLPWLALFVPVVMVNADTLDVLALGEEPAIGLGVPVERRRRLLLLAATAAAGASVAVAGAIAFVGLMGPHIARRVVGRRHRTLIPAAMLVGAVLVAAGDTIARTLVAPTELPVGVVVAALGAPYFLYLLTRSNAV